MRDGPAWERKIFQSIVFQGIGKHLCLLSRLNTYRCSVDLDHATISGAVTAIVTRKRAAPGSADHWGGLVRARYSNFVNNRRAVEFMRYRLGNNSKFIQCDFYEEGDLVTNSDGVTIWACKGILFQDNVFRDLDIAGISGYDFGANITTGNHFKNLNRAIEIYTLAPLAGHTVSVGLRNEEVNYFTNSTDQHIYADGTDEVRNLSIVNNDFTGARGGVYIKGKAGYSIAYNTFYSHTVRSIHCSQTGEVLNDVNCNFVQDASVAGMLIVGNNSGLTFKYNNFLLSPVFAEIMVSGGQDEPGTTRTLIGTPGDPAENCFTNPAKALRTFGATESFTYFIPDGTPACVAIPDNSLSNYDLETTINNDGDDCPLELFEPIEPPFAEENLTEKRQNVLASYEAWQEDMEDLEKESAYYHALEEKEFVLHWLLEAYLAEHDFEQAISILEEEETQTAQRWIFGIKLLAEDFESASQILTHWPVDDEDNLYFKKTMEINIQRLQNLEEFTLDLAQESFLYEVAYSNSYTGSYARSMLALLKGERFPVEELLVEPVRGEPVAPIAQGSRTVFWAYPNPAGNELSLAYPASEKVRQIEISAVSGNHRFLFQLEGNGSETIDISHLPNGIYAVRYLNTKNEAVHIVKISVIK